MADRHPLPADNIVLFTRFSTGSLHLTDTEERDALARQIHAARRALQASWKLYAYRGPYRILDNWKPRPVPAHLRPKAKHA